MAGKGAYTNNDITRTYRKIDDHIDTGRYILSYSKNTADIRDVALEGLDLRGVESAIDLGCSYGFFTEKMAPRLGKSAFITGIDIVDEENRDSFLRIVEAAGRRGRFIGGSADQVKHFESRTFDLVVASYSLYFFPHLIGEIGRILRRGGIFIAVTHTERSLDEIIGLIPGTMSRVGLESSGELAIRRLFRAFSMESGREKLEEFFDRIEIVVYPNKLVFPKENIEDCIDYLYKKRCLLFKEVIDEKPELLEHVMGEIFGELKAIAQREGAVEITKSDCIFRCYGPKV